MRVSLKKKVIILIVFFALILSGFGLFVSSYAISDIVDSKYKSFAEQISRTVSHLLDGDQVRVIRDAEMEIYHSCENTDNNNMSEQELQEYLDRYEDIPNLLEFERLKNQMRSVQDDTDAESIYLFCIDNVGERWIYLIDAAEEDPCPPGWNDPLYDFNKGILKDPTMGFPAYITDTKEYGWLLTSGSPIYASDGEIVGYAGIDISMNMIRDVQSGYFWLTVVVFIILTIILSFVGYIVASHFVVKPIKRLSKAADDYVNSDVKSNRKDFAYVRIRSHDEISDLAGSLRMMESDLNDYIKSLVRTQKQLARSKERVGELNDIAITDSLTGLKNKRAFDKESERINYEIVEGVARFGLVMIDLNNLKEINDEFGHDKGDIAITGIAELICHEFSHSPVYRVGGDEFVVLIERYDYDNVNSIIRRIRVRQKELKNDESIEMWGKMRAAIGVAIYDEVNDRSIMEVFKRADDSMYQNKKKMKEQDKEDEQKE